MRSEAMVHSHFKGMIAGDEIITEFIPDGSGVYKVIYPLLLNFLNIICGRCRQSSILQS
jgi:hypothetical protein